MKKLISVIAFLLLSIVSCKKEVYYIITTKVQPEGSGTIVLTPSSQAILEGTAVSFKANPNGDYVFSGWSGGLSGTNNPETITISSDLSVIANFTLRSYPLSVVIEGEGSVSEKVVSTKTDYSSGTVVELTAIPSSGWSFDHWEGDLSSADNPAQITISAAKSVKAVFSKNRYSYNLKIIGPGVVDEYLVETKSSFDYGSVLQLKAFPDVTNHAIFKGWSGDISGNETEISVSLDRNINVVATFASEVRQYPQPNLLLPTSVRKNIYYEAAIPTINSSEYCTLDYNRDGYLDLVTCFSSHSMDRRNKIMFYQGQADGSFVVDQTNSNRFDGLTWWRKNLYGDFNGDNIPDLCLVGHGWDYDPYPGEYPILLLGSTEGQFKEYRFTDVIGYFHGSAAGDIDNDGDMDIVLLDAAGKLVYLWNDGKASFTVEEAEIFGCMYTAELFDINHDGYLDLIIGGHEHEGADLHQYTNQGYVLFGDGKAFNNYNHIRFPAFEKGWGVTLDYIFEDLDGDGTEEIISCRTGDGVIDRDFYSGWKMHIVSYDGESLKDVTSKYINPNESFDEKGKWFIKIGIEEILGEKYLIGLSYEGMKHKLYKVGLPFQKCSPTSEQPVKYDNGFCIFSEGAGWDSESTHTNCSDEPYEGDTCIKFSNWETWKGWELNYPYWVDYSDLVDNDYVLEFAIRNSDPNLMLVFQFETRLQTEPWYFPSYAYTYFGSEHKHDGEWDLIRVPLSSLKCGEEWTGYYWSTIKTINIMPGECHGQDLYLDGIRIRKALQEDL